MNLDVETVSFGVIAAVLVASGLASSMVKRTFHSVMFLGVFLVAVAALYILLGSPLVGVIQILVYVGGILTLFVFAVMFVAGDETEVTEKTPTMKARSGAWSPLIAVGVAVAVLLVAIKTTLPANHAVRDFLDSTNFFNWGPFGWAGGEGFWPPMLGFGAGIAFIGILAVAGIVAWYGMRHAVDHWAGSRIFGTLLGALLLGLLVNVVVDPLDMVTGPAAWEGVVGTEADQVAANDLETVVDSLFGEQAIALELLGILLTAVMIGDLVLARPLLAPPDEDRYAIITTAQVRESQSASDVALHTEVGK